MARGRTAQSRRTSVPDPEERRRRQLRDKMRRGYRAMAGLNLSLAEEGPVFEVEDAPA